MKVLMLIASENAGDIYRKLGEPLKKLLENGNTGHEFLFGAGYEIHSSGETHYRLKTATPPYGMIIGNDDRAKALADQYGVLYVSVSRTPSFLFRQGFVSPRRAAQLVEAAISSNQVAAV